MTRVKRTRYINKSDNLTQRLEDLHNSILERFPGIARIACALYDEQTDLLKTFIHSTHEGHAIVRYEYPLSKSTSLNELRQTNECRVIEEMDGTIQEGSEHSNWLLNQQYRSSFTVPMTNGAHFIGFIFIDSKESTYFSDAIQRDLYLFCNMISLSISMEISVAKSLISTAKAVRDFAHLRDFETGKHLTRMAQFARLIATSVREHYRLSDETVEHIFLFASLHDIGKIGIPDSILLKPGRLNPQEYEVMKGHVTKGVDIITKVLDDYQLSYRDDSNIMLNIVAYHHELLDGTGYPNGLKADEIPVEARIVSVADIFDALTSTRPYKTPWLIDDALEELERMANNGKLDKHCVAALRKHRAKAEEIVKRYTEDELALS